MSDNHTPDEEHFEPSLNEDFDFGEEEPLHRPAQKTAAPLLIKRLTWGVVAITFGVILSLGYKIFGTPHHTTAVTAVTPAPVAIAPPSPPPPAHMEVSHVQMPHSTEAADAFATPPSPVVAHISPPVIPEPTPAHIVAPTPIPVTPMPANAPVTSPAPTPVTAPATIAPVPAAPTTTSITTTETIQELQRELFSPENPTGSEPAKTTVIVQNDLPTQHQVADLTTGLNKLNHQIDYILNQIKYLDSYTREVSDNLNKLNDSINTMDHRISTLSNTTSTLSQDMGNVRQDMGSVRSEVGHVKQVLREDGLDMNLGAIATPAQQQKKQHIPTNGAITLETPEYIVHAVIPGRAWLKSSKGQIITVTEGETLGNYGKILVIDAANGVVLTSSGIAFR